MSCPVQWSHDKFDGSDETAGLESIAKLKATGSALESEASRDSSIDGSLGKSTYSTIAIVDGLLIVSQHLLIDEIGLFTQPCRLRVLAKTSSGTSNMKSQVNRPRQCSFTGDNNDDGMFADGSSSSPRTDAPA